MFGALSGYEQKDRTVTLHYETQSVRIQVLTHKIIHVFVPLTSSGRRSKAIEGDKELPAAFTLDKAKDHLILSTDSLVCRIYDDFMLDFYGRDGNLLCADYRGQRTPRFELSESFIEFIRQEGHDAGGAGNRDYPVQCVKRLDAGDCIYGLGDKTGVLNKRFYEYENWNSDIPDPHEDCFKSLYKSIPFFITLKENGVYGIFYDNTFKSYFNFGKENDGYYSFGSDDGSLDYYFIGGDSMPEIVRGYTYLTGRMPLPQKWTLGYHQSRWGYDSEETFRELAAKLRELRIPCDALHFDIDYMEHYKVFTWDQERFPDAKTLISDLQKQGIKAVTIIDPGVKAEKGYPMYEEGIENGFFAKSPDGGVYVNAVWPGDAVYPDFGSPAVREWWGGHLRFYTDLGIGGIWNDMNEPASFNGPLPDDIVFTDEDRPSTHAEMHNVYGHNMAKATYEGWKNLTGKRPFVITRACYSGSQKYAAAWTGDNQSLWTHLRMAIPQQCNLGLSGMPFIGTDIGGFGADTTPELLIRWVELGCFSPLFRNHCAKGSMNQEPWLFGEETLSIYRKYVTLRYTLLPYFYDLCRECELTGLPIIRPLVLHYEKDENVRNLNDEFLAGEHLLVAPVVEQGARKRMVYLPEGVWYDYWTHAACEGKQYYLIDAPLDVCPIFVKAGTILPKAPAQMYVGEIEDPELLLEVYPGEGSYVHYRDNGEDFAYRDGAYHEYFFRTDGRNKLEITKQHEGYRDYPHIAVRYITQ
ncbi:MAG: glycoside hydrolase family 31 protein [Blautia sp.]|nr:glycoside hydrolase family 31 protein [Blautia sp.]MCM1200690.1 glycoside hydrolase family 31 protein [Bacteroides fragilis]